MIKVIYTVDYTKKQEEIDWLKLQKIYPATEDRYDWATQKALVMFGVIVSPEAAMGIKLRHKLDMHTEYRQK
jgi:hypothetical protein